MRLERLRVDRGAPAAARRVVLYCRFSLSSIFKEWILLRMMTFAAIATLIIVIIIVIIITRTIFMVLSSLLRAIARVHPVHLVNAD